MVSEKSEIKDKLKIWFTNRYNQAAILIFIFALALRLKYVFVSGMWWDECVYGYIGIELLKHPLSYSTPLHGEITIFSPFFPYLLSLFQFVLGKGEVAVRVVNPIISALGTLVIYMLGSALYNRKIGLISAALLSVSPLFWFQNEKALLETPLTVFMAFTFLLFYYGIEKNNKYALWAFGGMAAVTYLTRISAGFMIPIILLYLIKRDSKQVIPVFLGISATYITLLYLEVSSMFSLLIMLSLFLIYFVFTGNFKWMKNRNLWIACFIGLIILTPWTIRNLGVCGEPFCEIGQGVSSVSPIKETQEGSVFHYQFNYIKQLPFILSMGVFLFFLFGILQAFRTGKRADVLVLLWVFMFLIISGTLGTGATLRRILMLVPPAILLASKAIFDLSNQLKGKNIPIIALIVVIVLPLMFFSVQDGQDLIIQKSSAYAKLKDAGIYFEAMPDDTRIMTASVPAIAFYSGGKNVSWYPKNETDFDEEIKNRGIDYIVVDVYERLQPSWVFDVINNRPYLELQQIFYENDIQAQENFRVAVLKINKEKLN